MTLVWWVERSWVEEDLLYGVLLQGWPGEGTSGGFEEGYWGGDAGMVEGFLEVGLDGRWTAWTSFVEQWS